MHSGEDKLYLCFRWWPYECVVLREPALHRKIHERLSPSLVIGTGREFQPSAVPEKLLKDVGHAAAEVLWTSIRLFAYEAVVSVVGLWNTVPCPWQTSGCQEMDKHEGESFHVISPRRYYE